MESNLLPAARQGFWLALALGILSLLMALAMPVAGAAQSLVWLVVAWGIRRGQWGAALCGVILMFSGTVFTAFRGWPSASGITVVAFVISLVFTLLCGYGFMRASLAMRGQRSAVWPWAVLVGAQLIFMVCFVAYSMPSASMEKTLLNGESVIVDRVSVYLGRSPRTGDLVVFEYPLDRKQTFIKRVVGLPGDRIRIVKKQLFRNGTPVGEPYAVHATNYVDNYRDNFPSDPNVPLPAPGMAMLQDNVQNGEVIVPQGKYFVLGDNRDDSLDSRYWGFVSKSDMIGRPLLIYSSYDVEQKGLTSAFTTRWNRLLKPL